MKTHEIFYHHVVLDVKILHVYGNKLTILQLILSTGTRARRSLKLQQLDDLRSAILESASGSHAVSKFKTARF